MILRRVIAHFRKQEWTAIGLDFLIVVVGVFVGMQVNNWNAANVDARKAKMFSARLVADMRVEAWGYESLIEYNKDIRANAERAIAALSDDRAMSDEAFVISAYRATQFSFNDRKRATFDELIATGDFGLIADPGLRETAVLVFSSPIFDLIYDDGRESRYRAIFRETVPAEVQQALIDHCGDRFVEPGDYKGIVGSLDYGCALGLPAAKVAVAAAALRENGAVLPALQLRFADVGTALQLLVDVNRVMYQKLKAIAGVPA